MLKTGEIIVEGGTGVSRKFGWVLFDKQIFYLCGVDGYTKRDIVKFMDYIVNIPLFFHCDGQNVSYTILFSIMGIPYCKMTTTFCSNGVEFGIKLAWCVGEVVDYLSTGINIYKVLKTGILPTINVGMFNQEGG